MTRAITTAFLAVSTPWTVAGTADAQTDFCEAIVRAERTAMVRLRNSDKIPLRESCKIRLTHKHDLEKRSISTTRKGKAPALRPFLTCRRQCLGHREADGE